MARLVCLANSHKLGQRCIAGKLTDTGRWVRPVSALEHGEIAWHVRAVDGRDPRVLDILDIPLQASGPDYGCQPENRLLAQGRWRMAGRLPRSDVIKYVDADGGPKLFYNYVDSVPLTLFRRVPAAAWRSLQLILCDYVHFHPDPRRTADWRATFRYREIQYSNLKVTDPAAEARLNRRERLDGPCALTISLGMPFRPAGSARSRCYKLVAAVMRLDDAD